MPRPKSSVPTYSQHKASGQAFVRLPNGAGGYRFVYLGRYGSAESKEAYRRLLAEHDADVAQGLAAGPVDDPTVTQVFAAFLKHAERHYRPAHRKTSSKLSEYKTVSRLTRELYARAPAREFDANGLGSVSADDGRSGALFKIRRDPTRGRGEVQDYLVGIQENQTLTIP